MSEGIDRKIESRFAEIDAKLKEAFGKIKQDINEIKAKSGKPVRVYGDKIEQLAYALDNRLDALEEKINSKEGKKELEKLRKEVEELRVKDELAKQFESERKEKLKSENKELLEKERKELEKGFEKERKRLDDERKELSDEIKRQAERAEEIYIDALKKFEKNYSKSLKNVENVSKQQKEDFANQKREIEEKHREELIEMQRRYDEEQELLEKRQKSLEKEFLKRLKEIEHNNFEFREGVKELVKQNQEVLLKEQKSSEKRFSNLVREIEERRSRELDLVLEAIKGKKKAEQELEKMKEEKIIEEPKSSGFFSWLFGSDVEEKSGEIQKSDIQKLKDEVKGNESDNKVIVESPKVKEIRRESKKKLSLGYILAFVIPIAILLFFLYINFLPFGYAKDYSISINSEGDIISSSSRFYLEDLKGNKIMNVEDIGNGSIVRLVADGVVVLRNASVYVNYTGDKVFVADGVVLGDLSLRTGESFDFSSGIPASLIVKSNMPEFDSDNSCTYFSGNNSLELDNSEDRFESGAFAVFARWIPENMENNSQQIVGHYNWEVNQDKDKVKFQIGRVNVEGQTKSNLSGRFYTASYKVDSDFFGKEHRVLAIYNPDENGEGFIAMYVDGELGQIISIGQDTIYEDYNSDRGLSFGESDHGAAEFFKGCLKEVVVFDINQVEINSRTINNVKGDPELSLFGANRLESLNLEIRQ